MNAKTSDLPAPAGETSPARRRFRLGFPRRREKVVRRGVLATAIAPIAGALAVVLIVAAAGSIGTTWWTGYSRDQAFSRSLQSDGSVATVRGGRTLQEHVTVVMRDADGELRRLVVERDAADRFVNDTLRRLEASRLAARQAAAREVDTIFRLAFADRDDAVERYADWFFEWKRSYVVLKEAAVSAASRLARLGDYEPLTVGVERDLRDYFMRHYSAQVLRPDHRDPLIAAAFEEAARRAHERWLSAVAEQDLRLQAFLAEHTGHLDGAATGGTLTEIALDWDVQRFKAPTWMMEEKAFDGIVSLATIGAGGTLGALALRPAINRAMSRVFASLGQRYAAAFSGRIAMAQTGAAAGTMVQPVGGTVIGAVAGGLVGLAADYAFNEASAALNREAFVEANQDALDATIAVWQGRLQDSLNQGIDRWFDDTRAAVVSSG